MNFNTLLVPLSITFAGMLSLSTHAATFSGPMPTDTDNDGMISPEEVQSAFTTYYASLVSLYDADSDGQLSAAEKETMRADRQAETLAAHDADGDGKLSADEKQAIREARQQSIQVAFDTNSDGELSDDEVAIKDKALK